MIADRGWLTDSTDPTSLENAMRAAIQDSTAVEEFGRRCTAYVRENFATQRSVDRYRQSLLSSNPAT